MLFSRNAHQEWRRSEWRGCRRWWRCRVQARVGPPRVDLGHIFRGQLIQGNRGASCRRGARGQCGAVGRGWSGVAIKPAPQLKPPSPGAATKMSSPHRPSGLVVLVARLSLHKDGQAHERGSAALQHCNVRERGAARRATPLSPEVGVDEGNVRHGAHANCTTRGSLQRVTGMQNH